MIDRQKLETLLLRRFAGASPQQIAAAANAVMALEEESGTSPIRRDSGSRHRERIAKNSTAVPTAARRV